MPKTLQATLALCKELRLPRVTDEDLLAYLTRQGWKRRDQKLTTHRTCHQIATAELAGIALLQQEGFTFGFESGLVRVYGGFTDQLGMTKLAHVANERAAFDLVLQMAADGRWFWEEAIFVYRDGQRKKLHFTELTGDSSNASANP